MVVCLYCYILSREVDGMFTTYMNLLPPFNNMPGPLLCIMLAYQKHTAHSFVCMRKADIYSGWLFVCVSLCLLPGYLLPQYKKGLVCIVCPTYVHKIAFSLSSLVVLRVTEDVYTYLSIYWVVIS